MALDPDSLERLVPTRLEDDDEAAHETFRIHLERYEFAAGHARPGRLLDLACGVGYGTRLLADRNPAIQATGVDVSPEAIVHANERYASDRAQFRQGDAMTFEDPAGFDTIVSLETIEHVDDAAAFFRRLVSLLRPGAVLVGSVPTMPSVDLNPHHRHDFSERSFRDMGKHAGLIEIDALRQVQRIRLGGAWRGRRFKREKLRPNLPGYYLRHPDALVRRVGWTLRHGLEIHYLTLAWGRSG